ncbi:MAG: serine/threonine-protein kinase [Candidatus Sumerlaeia bacterium]|nr:serine/threonine-protein kinase [Candidatus Sumerlaeia bacterium]
MAPEDIAGIPDDSAGRTVSVSGPTQAPADFSALLSRMPPLTEGIPRAAAPPRYELKEQIGRGGMGVVHRAVQTTLGRFVAVKRLRGDTEPNRLREQFQFHQEAVIAARLEHPNIVPVHDFGVDETGAPMLSMKLVRGELWTEAIKRDWASMSPDDFLANHIPVLAQVAQAVAFAHSKGVVHRDLKPSQVMLGSYGEVLLMDWGLALLVEREEGPDRDKIGDPTPPIALPDRASASSPGGTPSYMAPEQTGTQTSYIGPWTDVYLLGGILYLLLTGSPPHAAANAQKAAALARAGMVEDPRARAPRRSMPDDLVRLAIDALEPLPPDRISSAADFHARLRDHLTGASRRQEAETLVRDAAGAAAAGLADYADCAEAANKLRRAETLWPGAPRRADTAAEVHAAWAELALARGDLQLAEIEAREVPADRGALLLGRVARASEARRRERSQRRAAVAGAFLLLAALLASSLLFTREVDARRAAAERDRRTAASRAESARGFARYMLEDLGEFLDPQVERDQRLIGGIAEEVMRHFRGLDVTGDAVEFRLAHAASLESAARSLLELARPADALELVRAAIVILRTDAPSDRVALCEHLSIEAECLAGLGDFPGALASAEAAIAEWRASGSAAGVEYAEAANNRGAVLARFGRVPEALSDLREAAEIRSRILGPDNILTLESRLNVAVLTMMGGAMEEARDLATAVEREAQAAHPEESISLEAKRLLVSLDSYAQRYDRNVETMRSLAAEYIRRYGPMHPLSLRARGDLSRIYSSAERFPEAVAESRAVIADMEGLERADLPSLTSLYDTLGEALLADGRRAEARETALRCLAYRLESLPGDESGLANTYSILSRADDPGANVPLSERLEAADKALAFFRRGSIRASPSHFHAAVARADLLDRCDTPDPDQWLEAYEVGVSTYGPASEAAVNAGVQAARSRFEAGQPDDARALLRRVLDAKGGTTLDATVEQSISETRHLLGLD